MDDTDKLMFVDFEKYCKSCEHEKTKEICDPCNDCLAVGARANSERPEYYKEKQI